MFGAISLLYWKPRMAKYTRRSGNDAHEIKLSLLSVSGLGNRGATTPPSPRL